MSTTLAENTLSFPATFVLTEQTSLADEVLSLPERVAVTREMACFLADNGFLPERYTLRDGTLYADSRLSERIPITRKMYYALFNADLIDEKTELLEGVIVAKMSQNRFHVATLDYLHEWLEDLFGSRYIQSQSPIEIEREDGSTTEPEPDIAVLRQKTREYLPNNPLPSDVVLLIEVADSTFYKDKVIKAPLYAKAGIVEYWIADTNTRTITVHREPKDGKYKSVVTYTAEQMISCLAKPDELKRVDELIAPATNDTVTDTVR